MYSVPPGSARTDTRFPYAVLCWSLVAELRRAVPRGRLLLRGGRALTMAGGDRIIADADILIEGDRIAAIGPRGSIAVPADTPVRDLGGRTVMSGFNDDHDHSGSIRRKVLGYEVRGRRAGLERKSTPLNSSP